MFDSKSVRLAHDTLKTLAYTDETAYYNGAVVAFGRLEKDPEVIAVINRGAPSRALSSEPKK